jgi:hypothetical protein
VRTFAALVGILAVAAAGCGEGDGGDGGSGVEVERADGTAIEFGGPLRAWCSDGQLWILNGMFATDDQEPDAFWVASAPLEKVRKQPRVEITGEGDVEEDGGMFVYDAEKDNELSSAQEEATGSIEFPDVTCERGAAVGVSVDATLDSEFGGAPSVTARGDAEAVIGDPVEVPD